MTGNMKKTNLLAGLAAALLAAVSCTGYFIDLQPTDTQTEANFYKTAAQFEAAANGLYSISFNLDSDTEASVSGYSAKVKGTEAPGKSNGTWTSGYQNLRKCNVLLQKAEEYDGKEDIGRWIATAHFFRAFNYFNLLRTFGGVPIVNSVLSTASEELFAPRNSRYEVFGQIINDLDKAIAGLPDESSYDGHITKQGAQAFKAHVLLFEGTWEKYVGDSTDGDGVSTGAGSVKPAGYPSVESMISEAAALAESVINSGKYELWGDADDKWRPVAYNYLFNLEDAESNPMGWDEGHNKESVIKRAYDFASGVKNGAQHTHNIWDTFDQHGRVSLEWMNAALCTTDGLPYLYSVDYNGYDKMDDQFKNRDYRLTSTVRIPGHTYFDMGNYGADASLYAKANYVDKFDFPEICTPYYPNVTKMGNSGFGDRKFTYERLGRADNDESFTYSLIRLAEMYTIYAEAKCELGNGSISDADLNKSINVLHHRAGVAPISNASISAANANYQKNTGGAGHLTIMDLIRNESFVEFRNEGKRFYDLLRWGIAEKCLNTNRLGVVLQNPDGSDTEIKNFSYVVGGTTKECYSEQLNVYGLETLPDGAQALIVNSKGETGMTRKNYLTPIPLDEIALNPALVQNPGF